MGMVPLTTIGSHEWASTVASVATGLARAVDFGGNGWYTGCNSGIHTIMRGKQHTRATTVVKLFVVESIGGGGLVVHEWWM